MSGRRPWSGPATSRWGWWTGPPRFPGDEEEDDQTIIAFVINMVLTIDPLVVRLLLQWAETVSIQIFYLRCLEVVLAHCENSTNGSLLHLETAPGLF